MFGVAQVFLTIGQLVLDNLQTLFLLQTMLQSLERLNPNDSLIDEIISHYAVVPNLIVPKWEGPWYCSYKQVIGASTSNFSWIW
jgi:hypothetical protein